MKVLVPGRALGPAERCDAEVALARIDPATGILHEPGHPLDGRSLAGRVLVCKGGKGSSSGSYILMNLAHRKLAPAALLVERADAVLVAGAVLGDIPLAQGADPAAFRTGDPVDLVLAGESHPGVAPALRILQAVAASFGTTELIPVASVHIGLSLTSLGEAGVDLLESLVASGERFVVPATTNVMSFERHEAGSPEARLQRRALDALVALGARSNCSCNPFAQGLGPVRGQTVAWSESATAPYLNGVLGARSNREGATALASALAGVTPRYGMHLDEGRRPGPLYHVTARLDTLDRFHLLGAVVGRRCANTVPALIGIPVDAGLERLYGFSAALAAHSPVAMFHAIGITPGSPSVDALYPGGAPPAQCIDDAAIEEERERWVRTPGRPDHVVIGCPHATAGQLDELAELLRGCSVGETRFVVHATREAREAARASGALAEIEAAGVRVTADVCSYVSLSPYAAGASLLTDSAKMAFLMATRGLRPAIASVHDCVRAATAG